MMIFYRERLAVIAIPKTGTTALENALGPSASAIFRNPPHIKHVGMHGFNAKYRKLFEPNNLAPIETMAIMREPVEWLGSWYRYRQRPALNGKPNSTADYSFDQFVEAYLKEDQPPFAKVGDQAGFVTDKKGELMVNHLFSYADLPVAVRFLERKLKREISLKRVNQSPKKQISLSPDLEAQLRETYELDFGIYQVLQDGPLSTG